MTLLDCAKLPNFVLIKGPGFAAIQKEGHKALIVYCDFGGDCEVIRDKHPLVQTAKSTRYCLDARSKFPFHRAVTADITAKVLKASNIGQFGAVNIELGHIANTHGLCFNCVDAETHSLGDVIVGG